MWSTETISTARNKMIVSEWQLKWIEYPAGSNQCCICTAFESTKYWYCNTVLPTKCQTLSINALSSSRALGTTIFRSPHYLQVYWAPTPTCWYPNHLKSCGKGRGDLLERNQLPLNSRETRRLRQVWNKRGWKCLDRSNCLWWDQSRLNGQTFEGAWRRFNKPYWWLNWMLRRGDDGLTKSKQRGCQVRWKSNLTRHEVISDCLEPTRCSSQEKAGNELAFEPVESVLGA